MQRAFFSPFLFLWFFACLLAFAQPVSAQKLVPVNQIESSLPMAPFMEWFVDPTGRMSIEDVASFERAPVFNSMEKEVPPKETGAFWLRFTLATRSEDSRPASLLLDMGDRRRQGMTLYAPRRNSISDTLEWRAQSPHQLSVFLTPDAQTTPLTLYVRMDTVPDLWFNPVMRTPENAATAIERMAYPSALVAMAVVMLLCILRGFTENGQWRIWTGLYTAFALFYAFWGAPVSPRGQVALRDLAAVVSPGLALMVLPHVARHLMDTRRRSRILDAQYMLLSLPGAALAVLPVAPGYGWVCRFLDLWPLGAAILLPTTLGSWISGLPGAARFLLGCVITAGGAVFALLDLGDLVPVDVRANAPLWGLALGSLIIAATAAPREYAEAGYEKETGGGNGRGAKAGSALELLPAPEIVLTSPIASTASSCLGDVRLLELEGRLRGPLNSLRREAAALDKLNLPPAARVHTEGLLSAANSLAVLLESPESLFSEIKFSAEKSGSSRRIFDLQRALREAHDSCSEEAEKKNVALSWFMPPHLANMYEGDGREVARVMRLLCESSVRATSKGAVQMTVRRAPESTDPGHLLFNITDTGTGMPPDERSSLALARAWELAGSHGGFLGLECGPQGTSISFTLRLGAASEEAISAESAKARPGAEPQADVDSLGIIIADENSGNRQLLTFYLEGLPHKVREARSCAEALDLYISRPSGLLIFDYNMPLEQIQKALASVRHFEKKQGLPAAAALAITNDDSQWDLLYETGFTHALSKPVTRTGLRRTVLDLLPLPSETENSETEKGVPESLSLSFEKDGAERAGEAEAGDSKADFYEPETFKDAGMPLLDLPPCDPPAQPQGIERLDMGTKKIFSRKNAVAPMPEIKIDSPPPSADHVEKELMPSAPSVPREPLPDSGGSREGVMATLITESAAREMAVEARPLGGMNGDAAATAPAASVPSESESGGKEASSGFGKAFEDAVIAEPEVAGEPEPSAAGAPQAYGGIEEIKEPAPVIPEAVGPPEQVGAQEHQIDEPGGAGKERLMLSELLSGFERSMKTIKSARGGGDYETTENASADIAEKADGHGLRVLSRIARCVEGAARARDGEALSNLLPDLETAVERTRITLSKGL